MNSASDFRRSHAGAGQVVLLLLGLLFTFVHSVRAQNTPQGSEAARATGNLSGVWTKPGSAASVATSSGSRVTGFQSQAFVTSQEPSMTTWAMDIFKANREDIKNPKETGKIELDPNRWCISSGPARSFAGNRPFEIRQLANRVIILYERDHWVRRIWTDGREHPKGYPTTWMGHSIGKWDGDTLVVDTVGINPVTWVDDIGHPQSDAMHMVERIRRVNSNTLEVETTFNDPKAYTKPWKAKRTFESGPPGYEILEQVVCDEWLVVGKPRRPEEFPHDSGKIYDREHPVTLTGAVTKYEFVNPHARIHFSAKDKNDVVSDWIAETASLQNLYRAGWRRNSLKPGDAITVSGFPAKDGKKAMVVRKLISPGGELPVPEVD